ncbi:MAG: aminotransferase class V-fold PLP-dependent enzyme [Cytophagales bacterium]
MLSFYPGPSKVYPSVSGFYQEAFAKGISGINHRSVFFQDIYKELVTLFKKKLDVPEDYYVFFVSSATECWEIVSQSLVRFHCSHIYSGDFGEKWSSFARALDSASEGFEHSINHAPDVEEFEISFTTEAICMVHCETSNSYLLNDSVVEAFQKEYPQSLMVLDATSSLGGVELDISKGDVWFASLQKCFGMPAGMAVLICSPKAIQKGLVSGERMHYNSLYKIYENYQKWQTTHTPNVLNFYVLMRLLDEMPHIKEISKNTYHKHGLLNRQLEELELEQLIENPIYRSPTVLTLKLQEEKIEHLKNEMLAKGIIVGNGYGRWSKNTFRIANFPAHELEDFSLLVKNLKEILGKSLAY